MHTSFWVEEDKKPFKPPKVKEAQFWLYPAPFLLKDPKTKQLTSILFPLLQGELYVPDLSEKIPYLLSLI